MRWLLIVAILTGCSGQQSFKWDNDLFIPDKTSDRYYTNGLEYSTTYPDSTGSHSYSLGQIFYTPGDKQAKEPLPEERPYAGFLYGGYARTYSETPLQSTRLGIKAGIVGPHAYAGETQNTVHRAIGDRTAKGWDNQLGTEIGIIGTYERQYYHYASERIDCQTTLGGNLGNVFTQGYSSFLFRLGINLHNDSNDNGPIFPRLPRKTNRERMSYYLHGGVLGRVVAHNITLDGNTFRDSAHIDKEPFVGEYRLGFGVEKGMYKFQYFYIVQSKEFDGDSGQRFGEIQINTGW